MIEYIGTFERHPVTIDGYMVPRIDAQESADGTTCNITLDSRFGATVPADIAEQVIWMIANAMAIGAGYSCHGENSQPLNPFKVKAMGIDAVDKGAGHE